MIQSKMTGKQPVAVGNIAYHLRCGDKNADWVFAGAIVFKSGLKKSQKVGFVVLKSLYKFYSTYSVHLCSRVVSIVHGR